MTDFLHLTVPASLREMGITGAAVFLASFSDTERVIEVELALSSEHKLPSKQIDDVYALGLELYTWAIARLYKRLMSMTRLEDATLQINAGMYLSEGGE